jgi:alpha-amylase/alpha-mannosidase (GH57 family)
MERYVCIHGHFYQPPRENPWLETIEIQDSAYPYHDWNERITEECYAPNAACRILDLDGKIGDIINNYSRISFNVGPTLMSWLQKNRSDVHQAIVNADVESREHFSGHGSAIAQAYNHIIMPLANARDKRTQVLWGLADFRSRFGRESEGMWLPETAVDLETLDVLAEQGLKFTILAPRQVRRIRPAGQKHWQDVTTETFDPSRPYLCRQPSGRSITLFFYEGRIAHDVSFGQIVDNGQQLAERLLAVFPNRPGDALVHIATDGELYGHHRPFADMALGFCLRTLDQKKDVRCTVYAEFLENHPPDHEVEIHENSSWSCIHGIGRWKEDCGCNTGGRPGWRQQWRLPLRETLNWLRDGLIPVYEQSMARYMKDPWAAREDYVGVILDRSTENVARFFARHARDGFNANDRVVVLKLLEMQRHALLMFTSCGWFFDELSGIETVQDMLYASRAMQLARDVSGLDLEGEFIERLRKAESNVSDFANGAGVYEKLVRPMILDPLRVAAHYAVDSVFQPHPQVAGLHTYEAHEEQFSMTEFGRQKLAIGQARIESKITGEQIAAAFAVLYLGDHNIVAGVRSSSLDTFESMRQEVQSAFDGHDVAETIQSIEKHFPKHHYSLWHLFRDEQRTIIHRILGDTIAEVQGLLRRIYDQYASLIHVTRQINMPLPPLLWNTLIQVLNMDLAEALKTDEIDGPRLEALVKLIQQSAVPLDKLTIGFEATKKLNTLAACLLAEPHRTEIAERICAVLDLLGPLGIAPNLWQAQNVCEIILKSVYPQFKARAAGDPEAAHWIDLFSRLCDALNVKIS